MKYSASMKTHHPSKWSTQDLGGTVVDKVDKPAHVDPYLDGETLSLLLANVWEDSPEKASSFMDSC